MKLLQSLPNYSCKLPTNSQFVSYRPFVVSEEKKLLLTKITNDKKQILLCVKEMVQDCFKISDISDYSITDVEYMLLQLRGKSAGETEPFKMKCPFTEEDVYFTVSIANNLVINQGNTEQLIPISKKIKILMDIPKFKHLLEVPEYNENIEGCLLFMVSCVLEVQENGVCIIEGKDKESIFKFINKLKPKQIEKIINYFDSVTSLHIQGKYLTKSKEIKTVKIKGLFDIINLFYDYINLFSYYKLAFQMKYYHYFSLEEIESLIPWERQIYVEQIKKHLEDQEKNNK